MFYSIGLRERRHMCRVFDFWQVKDPLDKRNLRNSGSSNSELVIM